MASEKQVRAQRRAACEKMTREQLINYIENQVQDRREWEIKEKVARSEARACAIAVEEAYTAIGALHLASIGHIVPGGAD